PISKSMRRAAGFLIRNVDARAGSKVRPQFPYRSVKGRAGHLRGSIRWRHGKGSLMPVNQIQQAPMADLDSFRLAGRAGCVNYICQILWLSRVLYLLPALLPDLLPIAIDAYYVSSPCAYLFCKPLPGYNDRRRRVFEYVFQPLFRVLGV